MGWECITDNCRIINGEHNGQGLAYYSISEEISKLHSAFFEFIANMSPGIIAGVLIISFMLILIYIFFNIRDKIKDGY
jgi:hypothetical protein